MARSTARVNVLSGCLGSARPDAEIVDGGAAAIRVASGQTLHEAFERRAAAQLDMVGGGYPLSFDD